MNIMITKAEHERLSEMRVAQVTVGSKLYGTDTESSDTDILCIYKPNWLTDYRYAAYPNFHQFQYKDSENWRDYLWLTWGQFYGNLNSGDSTINADAFMFGMGNSDEEIIEQCRTYKVIKAFLGFAKRDLKHSRDRQRLWHAKRGIYCAERLMCGEVPRLEEIRSIRVTKTDGLKAEVKALRSELNSMYDKGQIADYYIPMAIDPLFQKLLDANNIREFRYG